jgi:glutathione synthase
MNIGIIMDPIAGINIKKDSSFAMLLAAQARNWEIYYMEMDDLFLVNEIPGARMRRLTICDRVSGWYEFQSEEIQNLANLDVILMRKDPPLNMQYVYTTYLLELAQKQGVLIVNDPKTLRDANEKLFITWFPQCIVSTLVTRNAEQIRNFIKEHTDIILKPLDGMGGASIFRIQNTDTNANVIIETLTKRGKKFCMVQRYIPEISEGDKRILIIDGNPVSYALARIPQDGENRANLATGGMAKGIELSERDKWICDQLAPTLREKNLLFVGIDVIGDYLTEINITSPTCIRELDALYDLNIADQIMSVIENK